MGAEKAKAACGGQCFALCPPSGNNASFECTHTPAFPFKKRLRLFVRPSRDSERCARTEHSHAQPPARA